MSSADNSTLNIYLYDQMSLLEEVLQIIGIISIHIAFDSMILYDSLNGFYSLNKNQCVYIIVLATIEVDEHIKSIIRFISIDDHYVIIRNIM